MSKKRASIPFWVLWAGESPVSLADGLSNSTGTSSLGLHCWFVSFLLPLRPKGPSKVPLMTLQLLDFCLSILTLCSSYMEVPTYLNFKAMNHMVSLGQGPAPITGCVAVSELCPLSVPPCLGSLEMEPGRRMLVLMIDCRRAPR